MFTTALAIALNFLGLGFGTAAMALSLLTARRQRLAETAFQERTQAQAVAVLDVARQSSANQVAARAAMSDQALTFLHERLDGLELLATDQLITRAEVSGAFAELAAIEEQRQQQAARSARATGAPQIPAPVFPVEVAPAPADPWGLPGQPAAPPVDTGVLLREIAAMNERLQQRMQGLNGGT